LNSQVPIQYLPVEAAVERCDDNENENNNGINQYNKQSMDEGFFCEDIFGGLLWSK